MIQPIQALTPAEILSQSRDLLAKGWCKGAWARRSPDFPAPKFCSMGAINMVTGGNEYYYGNPRSANYGPRKQAIKILADQVRPGLIHGEKMLAPDWDISVVQFWNDTLGLDQQEEVLHQFDLAAKIARGE